ncbi:minor capsid protein [Herbinix hemicellulosilytica]|uniref:Minor capsid protein n=1 Tax=Herbinix hemicellulosilytica TaxID=1564487 RepID=A0A0H5SHG8_HERHM|nr:minor capsid protein [Herbinix hemicellulosilytica]RBP58864.1 minor capsid protein [Herbinix hemicellulosilytica]CRZ34929.1 hypothetical protein HHT355_1729 [Herbinix hemicellulosilytica]
MQFNGRLEIKPTDILLKERGLQDMGPVQKYIDSECIRLMAPYTPMRNGFLMRSATLGTKIGSGEINQTAPYARYQYYGKLMVSSITGSAWARYGEKKVLTDKDLVHDKSRHPQAGPFWFERMKAEHKEEILNGARKVAGAK